MSVPPDMLVTSVGNWYGASRAVAHRIAPLLCGTPMAVLLFAGGMSELAELDNAKIIVGDLHRHVINLAQVMADPVRGPRLYRQLRRAAFCQQTLDWAREICKSVELPQESNLLFDLFGFPPVIDIQSGEGKLDWAFAYAICSWMGRGGNAGTENEFSGAVPIRYSPNGGGSAQRFQNWARSIPAWRRVLRRCEIDVADAIDVARKGHDSKRVVYYADAPWWAEGGSYKHQFLPAQHQQLAAELSRFKESRVVVRYGDCPQIRAIYPGPWWTFVKNPSVGQANNDVDEVLILNPPAVAAMENSTAFAATA